jgi:hypothetical protein
MADLLSGEGVKLLPESDTDASHGFSGMGKYRSWKTEGISV